MNKSQRYKTELFEMRDKVLQDIKTEINRINRDIELKVYLESNIILSHNEFTSVEVFAVHIKDDTVYADVQEDIDFVTTKEVDECMNLITMIELLKGIEELDASVKQIVFK